MTPRPATPQKAICGAFRPRTPGSKDRCGHGPRGPVRLEAGVRAVIDALDFDLKPQTFKADKTVMADK